MRDDTWTLKNPEYIKEIVWLQDRSKYQFIRESHKYVHDGDTCSLRSYKDYYHNIVGYEVIMKPKEMDRKRAGLYVRVWWLKPHDNTGELCENGLYKFAPCEAVYSDSISADKPSIPYGRER
jgi:hypothetical protein